MQVSAAALLAAMRKQDFFLSPGAYSEIEAGHTLPREPERFLEAVCPALAIEPESIDWYILRQYLVRSLVEQKFGPVAASWVDVDEDRIRQRLAEGRLDLESNSSAANARDVSDTSVQSERTARTTQTTPTPQTAPKPKRTDPPKSLKAIVDIAQAPQ
jgi:hypothetical protein